MPILIDDINNTEYHPYFSTYLKLAHGDLIEELTTSLDGIVNLLDEIPNDKYHYSYEKNKWTVLQLLQHCIDTERVFQYRIFTISRGDKQLINGYDENEYANNLPSELIHYDFLLKDLISLRTSTIAMLKNLPEPTMSEIGHANGNPLSARAAGFIILGHWAHHLKVLKDRYLE